MRDTDGLRHWPQVAELACEGARSRTLGVYQRSQPHTHHVASGNETSLNVSTRCCSPLPLFQRKQYSSSSKADFPLGPLKDESVALSQSTCQTTTKTFLFGKQAPFKLSSRQCHFLKWRLLFMPYFTLSSPPEGWLHPYSSNLVAELASAQKHPQHAQCTALGSPHSFVTNCFPSTPQTLSSLPIPLNSKAGQ